MILYLETNGSYEPQFYVLIDFALKFEKIYEVVPGNNSHYISSTEIKGFTLSNDFNDSVTFLTQNQAEAKQWTTKLAKLISQKGFHREFKPIKTLGKGSSATVYEVLRI